MIVVDPVANYIRRGRPIRAAHLLSDLTGYLATKELMGFAIRIGLKAGWMQADNSEHEHFDLFGKKIDEAVAAGAVKVDRHRLVEIIREKRKYYSRVRARAAAHAQTLGAP